MTEHPKTDGWNGHLRAISSREFMVLGVKQIAYVKPVALDDRTAFVVHAADGTPLSVHDDAPDALMTARHNDLVPVTLH